MKNTVDHYQDSYVDMRIIYPSLEGFNQTLIVMTNCEGKVESLSPEEWWFDKDELLKAYGRLYKALSFSDGKEPNMGPFEAYVNENWEGGEEE